MIVSTRAAHALLLATGLTCVVAAPAPVTVTADDVILYGNGRFSIVKRSDFAELEAARNGDQVPPKPSYLENNLITFTGNETMALEPQLRKRDDDDDDDAEDDDYDETIIVPGPNSRFLGWDVQMSQVVKGAPTSVSVTSGFTIGNSISVGITADIKLIKDVLGALLSVDYTRSWQSTQTQIFQAFVPNGTYGAFVSNPWTSRASGNIWRGTIGGEGSLSYYQADSFAPKKFDNMEWVDGVISLCTGPEFPLKRCLGEGTI